MEDNLSETVKKQRVKEDYLSETHIQKRTAEKKKEEEIGLPKKKTHKVQEEKEENKVGESKRGYQGAKTLL